jgi:hypothetical protein
VSVWRLFTRVVDQKGQPLATPVRWWRGSSRMIGEMSWHYRSVSDDNESFEDWRASAIAPITHNHVWRIQTHCSSIRRSAMVCAPSSVTSTRPTPLTCDGRKIPWRLSAPQKLRQRRRLRRVDNIVSVLDSALQRQVTTQPATTATRGIGATSATTEELAQTAQGQRLMNAEVNTPLTDRRHGRGPKRGDILSGSLSMGTATLTADQARKMGTIKLIERWKAEMPTEAEMLPRDKYTMFDRKEKKYRKGIHSEYPPIPHLSIPALLIFPSRAA